MRFTGASFAQHALGKRGAIVEDDGEIRLHADLNLVATFGAPVHTFTIDSVTEPLSRSVASNLSNSAAGAAIAQADTMVTLAPGIWVINWWFSMMFTGTSNVNGRASLELRDASSNDAILAAGDFMSGMNFGSSGAFVIDTPNNLAIRLISSATVAGDVMACRGSVLCQPLAP